MTEPRQGDPGTELNDVVATEHRYMVVEGPIVVGAVVAGAVVAGAVVAGAVVVGAVVGGAVVPGAVDGGAGWAGVPPARTGATRESTSASAAARPVTTAIPAALRRARSSKVMPSSFVARKTSRLLPRSQAERVGRG